MRRLCTRQGAGTTRTYPSNWLPNSPKGEWARRDTWLGDVGRAVHDSTNTSCVSFPHSAANLASVRARQHLISYLSYRPWTCAENSWSVLRFPFSWAPAITTREADPWAETIDHQADNWATCSHDDSCIPSPRPLNSHSRACDLHRTDQLGSTSPCDLDSVW